MDIFAYIFEDFELKSIRLYLAWFIIYYTAVLLAMAIDLVVGVAKAKKAGIARRSTGYKRTCDKATKYFFPMLCLSCIDIMLCPILPFPVFTLAMATFNVYCEYRSVMENTHEKAEIRKAEKTMSIILENKDDLAKAVAKVIKAGITEKQTENGTETEVELKIENEND